MLISQRLRDLRKAKSLSRKRLNELSKVSVRTIQRLELEAHASGRASPHRTTVERLARALQVDPGVLTGELPLPQAGNAPAPEPARVQVGVAISSKARLAYDLIKRRYGVSPTEIINMAPLFFTLLAELSLARRRRNLGELCEVLSRLTMMHGKIGHSLFGPAISEAEEAEIVETESIAKADIFGEHLLSSDVQMRFPDAPFNPEVTNPFSDYLRRLVAELDCHGIVDTTDDLRYGSPYAKFPGYDICSDEVDTIAHGSIDARRALELGNVRLSDIPQELLTEDAKGQLAAWLEEKLPAVFKTSGQSEAMSQFTDLLSTKTPSEQDSITAALGAVLATRVESKDGQEGGEQ